ncbi:hypothetical protein AAH066_10650 [Parabacteroides distasonis]|uniref:hypothetical protein n=1 Tax=Parabacteroides distasonis TaxID=823 RepID=UPI0039B55A57
MVAGTAEKALETPPEGNVRKPLSGAVSGQPDKILHGGPAQAERHGSLHGIHRAYRRQSHKGGKRAGSGQPAAGPGRSTGKNASDKGGAPGGTPRKHMEAHLRIWRNNRRKTGTAQTGRLPEGARKGDRPYRTRRDGAFTRLPELRGL